eukprot:3491196-Pyramimonas_sp.AAC.2
MSRARMVDAIKCLQMFARDNMQKQKKTEQELVKFFKALELISDPTVKKTHNDAKRYLNGKKSVATETKLTSLGRIP